MSKKMLAGVLGSVVLASAIYLKTTYQVARVIDGDTFVTTDKQTIRLNGIDAPETDRCEGSEAKIALERLILHKRLLIKVVFTDKYRRLVSQVYSGNDYINEKMLKSGAAFNNGSDIQNSKILIDAANEAKIKKIGIYSSKCTQTENPIQPKCNIKGNNNEGSGRAIYHYPGCGQYNHTDVQLYLGDEWFCTKAEAEKAGFKKAQFCP